MTVSYAGRLRWRLQAAFHLQVELDKGTPEFATPSLVPVEGRVTRVFRSKRELAVGDRVKFYINVRRPEDPARPGTPYVGYDNIRRAKYVEIFLNGSPPEFKDPPQECFVIDKPSKRPQLPASWLAYYFEKLKGMFHN